MTYPLKLPVGSQLIKFLKKLFKKLAYKLYIIINAYYEGICV